MTMRLSELQRLLYRLITAPEGVTQGLAAERVLAPPGLAAIICGDERLGPEARLAIYANMYFHRLLAVLKEDYPATLRVLGDSGFHNLVTGYLIEYPPTEPSVFHAGRHLADYLRAHPIEQAPFLGDLAALERALVEAFVAADAPALDSSTMRAVEPGAWPQMHLRTHPATLIVASDWEVAGLLHAIEAGHDWQPPARRRGHVLAWRSNAMVFYREVERAEAAALACARRGVSFAAICAAAERELGGGDAVAEINRMLERWLADGILVRADVSRARG
jgi:hypothetical protein